jgi:hypothetical protein
VSEVEMSGSSESVASESGDASVDSAQTANVNSAETSKAAVGANIATGTTPQVVPPAYQPNFKYKFAGKEHEIDETFRSIIKDQETEKKVKEMFQRSMAFDDSKAKWDEKVKTHYEPTVQQYQALDKDVKRVMGFRNSGDLDSFFQEVRLPYEQIKNWVIQQEELAQNPQQKALYDQAFQERRARANLEEQLQNQTGQMQEVQSREREFELHLVMARPEVTEVANRIEGMMGEGAFRQLVVDEGVRAWSLYQRDLSAQDAVNLVLQRFGKLASGSAPSEVIQNPASQGVASAGMQQKPPVIPNVSGKGTSPVKKVPKSIDDIKKIYQEKYGNSSMG